MWGLLPRDPQSSTGPRGLVTAAAVWVQRGPTPLTVWLEPWPRAKGSPGTLPPAYLRPERHDARQESDEDVCVHAALVGFVDDHHLVLQQQEVLGVGQQVRPDPPRHSIPQSPTQGMLEHSVWGILVWDLTSVYHTSLPSLYKGDNRTASWGPGQERAATIY